MVHKLVFIIIDRNEASNKSWVSDEDTHSLYDKGYDIGLDIGWVVFYVRTYDRDGNHFYQKSTKLIQTWVETQ